MKYILLVLFVIVFEAYGIIDLSHETAIKYAGELLEVTCKDSNRTSVTWQGPKGILGPKTHPQVQENWYGTSIWFEEVNLDDSGNYTCSSGPEEKNFHLIVKQMEFMDVFQVQTFPEFTDATLRCDVTRKVPKDPIVVWKVEDGSIDGVYLQGPKFSVHEGELLIRNITKEDSKPYTCKVINRQTEEGFEQSILLNVTYKPIGVTSKASEEAWSFIGGEVNLTCEVQANPPPTFGWYSKKFFGNTPVNNFTENTHKSILQIHVLDIDAFGSYKCIAKNSIGTYEKTFHLINGTQAPPPDYIDLQDSSSGTFHIGIYRPRNVSDDLVEGFKVQYKPKHEEYWQKKYFPLNQTNLYVIRDLNQDTDYYIKVATKSKTGFSVYTELYTFRTLQSAYSTSSTNRVDSFLL